MVRPLFHDKRGVSEVIASLLMVLIVSIGGAALYSYSLGTFSSSSSSFQLQTDLREERARERFQIIAVWWNVTTDYMNVTILNYGEIELAIEAVYINGTRVSISSGRGISRGTGKLISIKFTSPLPIDEGDTCEILVVSERGSKDAVYWKAWQ